jgi:hypothetical protein
MENSYSSLDSIYHDIVILSGDTPKSPIRGTSSLNNKSNGSTQSKYTSINSSDEDVTTQGESHHEEPQEEETKCSNIASTLFHDQRKSIIALYAWLAILIGLFVNIGIGDSTFLHFGPSENAEFMTIKIDTWSKWTIIAVFQFCNTFINIFVAESMFPWIQNTIQDHKNKYLPYSKSTCMWICQTYYFYGNIVSMFGLFAMFVQVDFLVIRTVADILVSYYTTNQFLKTKTHDAVKYKEWFNEPVAKKEETANS